jgi:hypothetical protein
MNTNTNNIIIPKKIRDYLSAPANTTDTGSSDTGSLDCGRLRLRSHNKFKRVQQTSIVVETVEKPMPSIEVDNNAKEVENYDWELCLTLCDEEESALIDDHRPIKVESSIPEYIGTKSDSSSLTESSVGSKRSFSSRKVRNFHIILTNLMDGKIPHSYCYPISSLRNLAEKSGAAKFSPIYKCKACKKTATVLCISCFLQDRKFCGFCSDVMVVDTVTFKATSCADTWHKEYFNEYDYITNGFLYEQV